MIAFFADDGTPCALCKQRAQGYAEIDGNRYCHPDTRTVNATCYEQALWAQEFGYLRSLEEQAAAFARIAQMPVTPRRKP